VLVGWAWWAGGVRFWGCFFFFFWVGVFCFVFFWGCLFDVLWEGGGFFFLLRGVRFGFWAGGLFSGGVGSFFTRIVARPPFLEEYLETVFFPSRLCPSSAKVLFAASVGEWRTSSFAPRSEIS